MQLSERIYNAFLGGIVNKVVLAEWFTDAKHLEAENKALREWAEKHRSVICGYKTGSEANWREMP